MKIFLLKLLVFFLIIPSMILTMLLMLPAFIIGMAFFGGMDSIMVWSPFFLVMDWAAYLSGKMTITPLFDRIKAKKKN